MSSLNLLMMRRAERAVGRGEEEDDDEEEDAPTDTYFTIRDKFVNQEGFRIMCEKAFDEVDFNGNGRIDLTEFYAGVLLLYDKVNSIPWGGRKKPPKRKAIEQIFKVYLKAQKGEHDELTYETFELILRNHFDQLVESILWRILTITILFPILSVYLSQAVFSIPGIEDALGRFASVVPTIIVSALVTLLPFIEKLLANLLTKEQKLSIRFAREGLEKGIRGVVLETEKDIYSVNETVAGLRDGRLRWRNVPNEFLKSRRRWSKAEERRRSFPRD